MISKNLKTSSRNQHALRAGLLNTCRLLLCEANHKNITYLSITSNYKETNKQKNGLHIIFYRLI